MCFYGLWALRVIVREDTNGRFHAVSAHFQVLLLSALEFVLEDFFMRTFKVQIIMQQKSNVSWPVYSIQCGSLSTRSL